MANSDKGSIRVSCEEIPVKRRIMTIGVTAQFFSRVTECYCEIYGKEEALAS